MRAWSSAPLAPAPAPGGPGHPGRWAWAGPLAALSLVLSLLGAGAVSALLAGRGWAWPPRKDVLAAALSPVLHPGDPGRDWPGPLHSQVGGWMGYWAVFTLLVAGWLLAVLVTVAALGRARPTRMGWAGAVGHGGWLGHAGRGRALGQFGPRHKSRRRRPGAKRRPARSRRGGRRSWPRLAWGPTQLPDRRDRFGFASRQELGREASVAAARRRAAQTRPSLLLAVRARRRSLAPAEVGYPLGRALRCGVGLWPSWEASLRLVAPPGEGKTFRVLVPILRQHPGPALATSTKADLYELTAVARQRLGPVVAFDPDGLIPGACPARWSPVAGCERSQVAERRAAALVCATGDEGDSQNAAFFHDSARDLLKAYLHAAALEGLDVRAVLEWSRHPEDPAPAELLASSPWAAPGWGDLVLLHTTGAAETTSGVLRYVSRALACFSHQAVIDASCPPPGDELDIAQLLKDNGSIYLMGKASRLGAVAPLLTAMADEVFDVAERLSSAMPSRRLDPPLLGLLDEAPSIAPVPSLPDLLADGRGRGIVMVYAMQSFSQAVSRWGAQKAETMGNATTITAVLGGLTSPNDLADLEKVCGQRRARRESVHRGSRGQSGQEQSRTTSWDTEPVLRADQIRTLPSGTALVLWSKLPPVLSRLRLLSERRDWPQIQAEEHLARQANDQARV